LSIAYQHAQDTCYFICAAVDIRRPPPGRRQRRGLLEPVPSLLVSDVDGASAALELEEWIVTLLKWALLFFVISVVAGILGFTGISAASADVARILFYIFLVIFLVLLVLGLTIFRV
jgi:uncharacterized membrane protein YtjA (UPF0391 family)